MGNAAQGRDICKCTGRTSEPGATIEMCVLQILYIYIVRAVRSQDRLEIYAKAVFPASALTYEINWLTKEAWSTV